MKRMGKIIMAGLCLGLPLLFVKIVFQIPDDVFWKYYLICGGIAVVGTTAFNILYNRRYLKKMQAAAHLLESNRAEEYICLLYTSGNRIAEIQRKEDLSE